MTAAGIDALEGVLSFSHRFLDIGEARVHVVDEGTGPVLLMLHREEVAR